MKPEDKTTDRGEEKTPGKVIAFETLSESVGRFNLKGKTLLIPQMNRVGGHLLAAVFRGFGVPAVVMETAQGMDLGKEYTSGKECYPCQITLGDILHCMRKERDRLGDAFDPAAYVYFMPEAAGPCRFGMYNKYQRIVLDSFPELKRLKIGALTTQDGYSLDGVIDGRQVRDLRKVAYVSVVAADILDRLLWRVRPYEKREGAADAFIEDAMGRMESSFEQRGPAKDFDGILDDLDAILREAAGLIDPGVPPKPLIGIVGEIYLRTHVQANQDVIRVLERYGAEVVNASIAEWINYTSYERFREAKIAFRLSLKQLRLSGMKEHLKGIVGYGAELFYQQRRQDQIYRRARASLDLVGDHRVGRLEQVLKEEDVFAFDVGTEACLSIPGILEYAREKYNGVVNVFPFTCMPSTMTSAVVRPLMDRLRIPYLDTPYDSGYQPGREAAIRTFMYQAHQHFKRQGRKAHGR